MPVVLVRRKQSMVCRGGVQNHFRSGYARGGENVVDLARGTMLLEVGRQVILSHC